jgi:hypothetical protein
VREDKIKQFVGGLIYLNAFVKKGWVDQAPEIFQTLQMVAAPAYR